MQPTGPSPPRGWRVNVIVLLVTSAVCLGVLEAAARLTKSEEPSLLVLDPVVGKRFVAGFAGRVYVPEAGREVELRFNREGMRGPDWTSFKPPGVRRLALLGDSMIASVATDEDKTLARRLEDLLTRDSAAAWQVLNFGVSSSSTGTELVLYREVAARYQPDVVLCAFFVGNDLADNSYRLTQAPRIYFDLDEHGELRQLPFSAAQSAGRTRIASWLDAHSRLYAWQKAALRGMKARLRTFSRRVDPGYWIFSREESPEVAEAWRITGRLLGAFRREVESRGSRFAVVLVPCAEQVYDDLWHELTRSAGPAGAPFDRDHPEERLRELCHENGVELIAMTAAFRARAPHASSKLREEWLFHQGRWHFNDRGQEIAAQAVYEALRPAVHGAQRP
jgi:hypothetical protein